MFPRRYIVNKLTQMFKLQLIATFLTQLEFSTTGFPSGEKIICGLQNHAITCLQANVFCCAKSYMDDSIYSTANKFLPSLPVTAERGSAPSAHYPPEWVNSDIATCSVVGDTYRPVAKLSPALGWWTLPCLACLWARIRAHPAKQPTGWRNAVTNV